MKGNIGFFSLLFGLTLVISTEIPQQARAQSDRIRVYLPVTYNHFDSGPGSVKGEVIEATDGSEISGATICYQRNCLQTDSAGMFRFDNIPAGAQYFSATMADHYPVGRWTNVIAYQENQLNIVMSQILSNKVMRIVTTWSTNPVWPPANYENDLDAFMWVTTANITPTLIANVSRDQCTSYPYACKENDSRRGTGPETIAIQHFTAGSSYYFGVLNYNQYQPDVPPISQTQAAVSVYTEQGLEETFTIPNTGIGNFWYVFSMDANGRITPKNCILQLSPDKDTLPDCNLGPPREIPSMPTKP
jgi:hypothetical protein